MSLVMVAVVQYLQLHISVDRCHLYLLQATGLYHQLLLVVDAENCCSMLLSGVTGLCRHLLLVTVACLCSLLLIAKEHYRQSLLTAMAASSCRWSLSLYAVGLCH